MATSRRALVTGVRRGIGRATVDRLIDDGLAVAGTIRPGTTAPRWSAGPEPFVVEADATDAEQTRRAVDAAAEHLGSLDVIVANAGRGAPGHVLGARPEQWLDQALNKLASVAYLVDAALPYLRESSSPRVVIVSGITAVAPDAEQGVVSAMRAAQSNLATNLARDLAAERICVNTVLLGAIRTDRQRDRFDASGADDFDAWEAVESRRRGIPFGRFGSAEEAAALIAFLASDQAGYITGAAIPLSGGLGP